MATTASEESPHVPGGEFQENLKVYLKAGYPILYIVTSEEDRAIELVGHCLTEGDLTGRRLLIWSVSRGLCTADYKPIDRRTADPAAVLPYLLELQDPGVFILEDFHGFIDERSPNAPMIVRQLRDVAAPFRGARKTIVILSPVLKIPPELEKEITVLDLQLPDMEELAGVLDATVAEVEDNPRVELNLDGDARESIVQAMTGLTRTEAENALAKAIVTRSRLDPEDVPLLLAEKEQIIRKSGMLEFYSTPEQFGSIGGLENLKAWLRQRAAAFTEAARAYGLPNPKGLMLVGVPGCGKSLSAKAVASEWNMPLLKFDLGRVYGQYVGQSEENMRRALKMAEAVSPCILWIDEIEKGLAGMKGGGQNDGGVAVRVFGTLLTWMEENDSPVFTIATANNIDGLPPELLRKGRFDEIFFIDMPSPAERASILAIHLLRRDRDYKDFDLPRHVEATDGFSGAELEQAVISAIYLAFAEGEKTRLADRHLTEAISTSVPLSRSMGGRIARLRKLAADSWRDASAPESPDGKRQPGIKEAPPVPPKRKRIFEV